MTHDPALEAHEHREHAEHAGHSSDPLVGRISITIAALAVLASAAGSLETVEGGRAITASSESVLAQDQATDAWGEYQADSLKKHIYDIAANVDVGHAIDYRRTSHQEIEKQGRARARALHDEGQRDELRSESRTHERRHHWLTASATLIEIGIAMSTVAIITKRLGFWFGAMGLGMTGFALFGVAYAF